MGDKNVVVVFVVHLCFEKKFFLIASLAPSLMRYSIFPLALCTPEYPSKFRQYSPDIPFITRHTSMGFGMPLEAPAFFSF